VKVLIGELAPLLKILNFTDVDSNSAMFCDTDRHPWSVMGNAEVEMLVVSTGEDRLTLFG